MVIAAGVLVRLLVAPAAALVTAPGENGQIAFRRYLGPTAPKERSSSPRAVAPASHSSPRPRARRATTSRHGARRQRRRFPALRCQHLRHLRHQHGRQRPAARRRRLRAPPAEVHRQLLPGDLAPTARIAFNRAFGHIRNDEIDPSGIHRTRIASSRIHKVSLPATCAAVDIEPQWSPDGKQIVSVRHNATAKPADAPAIFVIKAHSTTVGAYAVPDQGLATAPTGRPTARRSSSAAPRPRTSCAATSGRSTPTAPLCGGPARRPANKGLLGVILPRRHGDRLPMGRGRRSDDVTGGANGRPCDVLGLAHLGTDAHLGAQPRPVQGTDSPEVSATPPAARSRPPPASAYRCAGGRVGGQARHTCADEDQASASPRSAPASLLRLHARGTDAASLEGGRVATSGPPVPTRVPEQSIRT